ncbi:MAG: ribosome small subunit-dependent GTPase A [Nocardioidaceae bacterium]
MNLTLIGWDEAWAESAAARCGVPGRVARVDRGVCSVLTAQGVVRASLSGAVLDSMARDSLSTPCTGDWVMVRTWPDDRLTLEEVLPRRSAVVRGTVSERSEGQVLAANATAVAVVVGLDREPSVTKVERLVAVAWESGAVPLVLLTKSDLAADAHDVATDVAAAAPGVDVLTCSTVTLDGIEQLRARITPADTMALVGSSGAGKSSLANALAGAPLLVTKRIRDDGRGRHTSVRRELVPLPGGGTLVDTPGLRGVGLFETGDGVAATFPDVEALVARCRFADCVHATEPDCAVRKALESGGLSARRYESWQRLQREVDWIARRTAARKRADEKRR